jgi:hypothetical protein
MGTPCTDDLQLYDPYVQTCSFSPSSGSDVHNFWYSPFQDDGAGVGHSGAYKLPLDGGAPPPTQISRAGFSATPPTVQCDDNADPLSMCVKVQDQEQTQLATASGQGTRPGDFSDGTQYDVSTCIGAGKRWITGATAFAPPPGAHQGRTTYEVRGCALKCVDPSPDLASLQMREVGTGTKSFDGNFSVKFKCIDGYAPPVDVSPAILYTPSDRDLMVGSGMDAIKCASEGGPYALNYRDPLQPGSFTVPAPACVQDCTLPSASSGSGDTYPGYDLVNTEAGLSGITLSTALMDSDVVSRHLACSDGYTLRPGVAVSPCSAPGDPIVINDETAAATLGGCIADCKPSDLPATNWDPSGASEPTTHDFHTRYATDHFKWQDTGDSQERSDLTNMTPINFSCPAGYESGPGSMGNQPAYEPCGNLPGHVNSMNTNSQSTRATYGLTGCYPICSSGLCYNYKTEKQIDLSSGNPLQGGEEESWRTQMGQMLNDHTSWLPSPLDETNISFVRRQVLNNGPDANMGKEILEWQIKCSDQQCTNDPAATDKINIDNILGQDGIPSLLQEWHLGETGDTCTETCQKAGNPGCTDGDWGITDEARFASLTGDVLANNPAGAITCESFAGNGGTFAPFVQVPAEGYGAGICYFHVGSGLSECGVQQRAAGVGHWPTPEQRLCKCDMPGTAPADSAPVAGGGDQYTPFLDQMCLPGAISASGNASSTISVQSGLTVDEAKNQCNTLTGCVGFDRDDEGGRTQFKNIMVHGANGLHHPQPPGMPAGRFTCYEKTSVAAPVAPSGLGWILQDDNTINTSCTATCAAAGRTCADGAWGADSEATLDAALAAAGEPSGAARCTAYSGHPAAYAPLVSATEPGHCYYGNATPAMRANGETQVSTCSEINNDSYYRFCKCL